MNKETKKAVCLLFIVLGGMILMLLYSINENFYDMGVGLFCAGLGIILFEGLAGLKK